MSKIEGLIAQHCPEGVSFEELGQICDVLKGKQLNKTELLDVGEYPAYNGGITYSGFTNKYNVEKNTTIISQGGASAGFVQFVETNFWANAHCYYLKPNLKKIHNKYLFYFVKNKQNTLMDFKHGAGIPALNASKILQLSIPLPPLPVQEVIVEILDKFTKLEAELEAELEARQQQYTHYRDELLSFGEEINVEWRPLGLVCRNISAGGDVPTNHIKGQTHPTEEFPYPIFANATGENGLYGYCDGYKIESDAVTISARGAKVGYHTIREGKFTPIIRLITLEANKGIVTTKYLNYALDMTLIGGTKGGIPQLTVPTVKKIEIPIPYADNPEKSLAEQGRIVAILDKFDALVNDISSGLPAEITARRRQYEHYRDKLLTFKEAA